ncbi:hypothetical protein IWQ60_008916 [Tieghemiomyces parasiticus]|uniref:Uncharacterized protein n=1 Tax=Tieghemiomyces parasiticus TaxID=78921 RepID=A0A9W7ZZM0_9FUNG|nr:hypothetical protein IWQ60_008916 [Tieghemiomyces parasiticus]
METPHFPFEMGEAVDEGLELVRWPQKTGNFYLPHLSVHSLPAAFSVVGTGKHRLVRLLTRRRIHLDLIKRLDPLLAVARAARRPPVERRASEGSDLADRLAYLNLLSGKAKLPPPSPSLPSKSLPNDSAPLEHLRQSAESSRSSERGLYLHGPGGLGKSHAAYSLAAHYRRLIADTRVVYLAHAAEGWGEGDKASDLHRLLDELEGSFHRDPPVVRELNRLRKMMALGTSPHITVGCLPFLWERIDAYSRGQGLAILWVYDHWDTAKADAGILPTAARYFLAHPSHVTVVVGRMPQAPEGLALPVVAFTSFGPGFTVSEARTYLQIPPGRTVNLALNWPLTTEQWRTLTSYTNLVPGELRWMNKFRAAAAKGEPFSTWFPDWLAIRRAELLANHLAFLATRSAGQLEAFHRVVSMFTQTGQIPATTSATALDSAVMSLTPPNLPATAVPSATLQFIHPLAETVITNLHREADPGLPAVAHYILHADFLTTTKGTVAEKYVHWCLQHYRRFTFPCVRLGFGPTSQPTTLVIQSDACEVTTLRTLADLAPYCRQHRRSSPSSDRSTVFLPQASNFPKFDWAVWHAPTARLYLCQMKAGKEVQRYITKLTADDVMEWSKETGVKYDDIRVVWVVARDMFELLQGKRFQGKDGRYPIQRQYVTSFQDNPDWPALNELQRYE